MAWVTEREVIMAFTSVLVNCLILRKPLIDWVIIEGLPNGCRLCGYVDFIEALPIGLDLLGAL